MTVWLSHKLLLAAHDEQLAEHGGAIGVREEGLLECALARLPNRAGYGDPDIGELAAVYAITIARDQPFLGGNNSTAYVALETFLALNGRTFPVSDADAVLVTEAMATSDITDDEFTEWVRANAQSPA